jgi:hypothetical protein
VQRQRPCERVWCTVIEEGNLGCVQCHVHTHCAWCMGKKKDVTKGHMVHGVGRCINTLPLDATSCLLAPCTPTVDAGHALLP